MANAIQKRQKFIRYFREQTGVTEWNMHDVAKMATKMGWPLPEPIDQLDLLAKQFADAAREEVREDKVTKKRYKANLAFIKRRSDGKQLWLWFDVDDATRPQMVKGLHLYREQMVSEAVIGVNTADHWNSKNPEQPPLPFITDLTSDVNERANAALQEIEKAV
ncbi:MAG TPA: hypothetical protein VN223_05015 [Candidatus Elarobacter sp.]|nr:hypothetical protein [Candidatus Elarobacter sp.]